MAIELNVFVAGSKALEAERDLFRIEAQNVQVKYKNKGVNARINVVTYESFSRLMRQGVCPQDVYNKYISESADIVFFILDGNVGGITQKEYDVAETAFKKNKSKKPVMGVFSRVNDVYNEDVEKIRERINNLHQYWCDYKDIANLRAHIRECFESEIDSRLKRRVRWVATITAIILGFALLGVYPSNQNLEPKIPLVTDEVSDASHYLQVEDELVSKGQLKIDVKDSGVTVKYRIQEEHSQEKSGDLCEDTILYPKTNCSITIWAYNKAGVEICQNSYSFDMCRFVQYAIKAKNRDVAKLFGEKVELIISDDNSDISLEPIRDLYEYITRLGYNIVSIPSMLGGDTSWDILSDEYPQISTIKLAK